MIIPDFRQRYCACIRSIIWCHIYFHMSFHTVSHLQPIIQNITWYKEDKCSVRILELLQRFSPHINLQIKDFCWHTLPLFGLKRILKNLRNKCFELLFCPLPSVWVVNGWCSTAVKRQTNYSSYKWRHLYVSAYNFRGLVTYLHVGEKGGMQERMVVEM